MIILIFIFFSSVGEAFFSVLCVVVFWFVGGFFLGGGCSVWFIVGADCWCLLFGSVWFVVCVVCFVLGFWGFFWRGICGFFVWVFLWSLFFLLFFGNPQVHTTHHKTCLSTAYELRSPTSWVTYTVGVPFEVT